MLSKTWQKASLFFVLMGFVVCGYGHALPDPYRQVRLRPFNDGQNWYNNREKLERLILQHNVKIIVEIGCWVGRSTRHMASLLPLDGKLYAVDHWLGSSEHQPGRHAYCPETHYLYDQFLSNVIHAGLTHKIVPVRMPSLEAAKYLSYLVPDLIYIDASHDRDSVFADLCAWYPRVAGHGILCGDDWGGGHGGVASAVNEFASQQKLIVDADDAFWRLREP